MLGGFSTKRRWALLDVPEEKKVLALVCLGKPSAPPAPAGRKDVMEKVRFIG